MNSTEEIQLLLELNGPALPPPPGVIPNFVDPPNLHKIYLADIIICVTFSTLVVAMRLYTRFYILRKRGWEDYTCILAYFMSIGYCIPASMIIRAGGGVHQWNVQVERMSRFLFLVNVSWIQYGTIIFVIKLSILLQYKRIFAPNRQASLMYWGVQIVLWGNLVFYIIITFVEIFVCSPRNKAWNVLLPGGHCFNSNAVNLSSGALNMVSDFAILLLPQFVIWKLQMPLRRKIGISLIFCTGFLACVVAILRLYYTVRLVETRDATFNIAVIGLWTYPEMTIGIICSCLPVMPRFFQLVSRKLSMLSSGIAVSIPGILKFSKYSKSSGAHSGGIDLVAPKISWPASRNKIKSEYTTLKDGVAQRSISISGNSLDKKQKGPQLQVSDVQEENSPHENQILRTICVETIVTTSEEEAAAFDRARRFRRENWT